MTGIGKVKVKKGILVPGTSSPTLSLLNYKIIKHIYFPNQKKAQNVVHFLNAAKQGSVFSKQIKAQQFLVITFNTLPDQHDHVCYNILQK